MSNTVYWYIHRLKTISANEILYRIVQLFKSAINRSKRKKVSVPLYFSTKHKGLIYIDDPESLNCDTTVNIFGNKFHPSDINEWHIDVSSKKCFPRKYSSSINIRNDKYGSAKHVWELNRMLFLPQLALDYRKNKAGNSLDLIIYLLSTWIDQNPYLIGINWYSNIEVNIRLINWVLTWDILDIDELVKEDKDLSKFVAQKWIPSIYSHCKFSYNNPSFYSSANNHLISEYAGLFIANCKWAFPESEKWLDYSRNGLEKEIILQHSENGINREETAKYIQFISDFLLLCLVFGNISANLFSERYSTRLHSIFKYINQLLDIKGGVPNYGDEDDGRVFILDSKKDSNLFYSLLISGSIIFKDPTILPCIKVIDQKNRLIFGKNGIEIFQNFKPIFRSKKSRAYIEEGHFIFRHQDGISNEIYFHFDAAPLGYLSIAAHGHSDALSFILHIDGFPYFVDPGTYCYHTHADWRQYFLSAKAHNTVSINSENQAIYIGPTLWLNHYKTKVISYGTNEQYDFVFAEHDGYDRFRVKHQRKVEFFKSNSEIVISDYVINDSNKEVLVEIPFHFHPSLDYNFSENTLTLKYKMNRTIHVNLDKQLSWNIHKGEKQPILGWYSESFYNKTPSPVCLGVVKTRGNLNLSTTLKIY